MGEHPNDGDRPRDTDDETARLELPTLRLPRRGRRRKIRGDEPEPVDQPASREPFTLPSLPGRVASIVAGAVVGLVGTALTYLSLQGCNAVRGTKSCGGGPGLLLLLLILVLMVLLGGVLLALWDVPEPRSASFLGVGVLAVVLLIASLRELDSVWMFLVVPVICALTFLLAHWVTTAFVELPENGPQHDIR
jgi:hypothetical protein